MMPPFPVYPGLHLQSLRLILAADELEWRGHMLHVDDDEDPTAAEYVPVSQSIQMDDTNADLYFHATHAVHVPPSGPE